MNKRTFALLGLALVAPALIAGSALAELTLPRPSPNATVTQTVGLTDITLTYSRPGVKDRKIWGDLVPLGETWRTGANDATVLECSDDIMIEGKKLPAGKYAVMTIPGRANWTVIFNSEHDKGGAAPRDPKKDVLTCVVTPEYGKHKERMSLTVENMTNESADLVFHWEKLHFSLGIEVETLSKALASARAEVPKAKEDDWLTAYRAASFLFDAKMHLDEATTWAEKSVGVKEHYLNTSLLAKIYAETGKKDMAITYAKKAIEIGKESGRFDVRPTEKLLAKWSADEGDSEETAE